MIRNFCGLENSFKKHIILSLLLFQWALENQFIPMKEKNQIK